jgi:hypothetical protein
MHVVLKHNIQCTPEQDCRKITDHFRRIYRIYPIFMKKNRRMSTYNRLDLQTLRSQTDNYAQKSPQSLVQETQTFKVQCLTLHLHACQAHLNPSPFAQKPPKFCLETILPYLLATCNYPHVHWTCCLHSYCVSILHCLTFSSEYAHNLIGSPINVGILASWCLQFPHVHEEVQEIQETQVLSSFLTIEATLSSVTREIVGHNCSKP